MLTSPARLSQRCRLGGPAHTAAAAGFSTQEGEVWRETDCLLEGNGFEISVPRQIGSGFEASVGLGPIDSRRGGTTRAVVGLGADPADAAGPESDARELAFAFNTGLARFRWIHCGAQTRRLI